MGRSAGGVNTFLNLIHPSTLDSIEVVRGTSSAQYGSDALGGSVQFLTNVPTLGGAGTPRFGGMATVGAETAHRGGMGHLGLNYAAPRFGMMAALRAERAAIIAPAAVWTLSSHLRFLGLETDRLIGEYMPGTGFEQLGAQVPPTGRRRPTR